MFFDGERMVCSGDNSETARFWEKGAPFRASVGVTCVLSMVGAVLIVVSYVFYKSLRNRARLILVHLSLMDFGVALSNLTGNIINFDQYYITYNGTCVTYHLPTQHVIGNLCETQAFFSHFFTMGSVLWTVSLAVYLYFLLMYNRTSLAPISIMISYVLCYGFPLLISLWLLFTKRFGYSEKSFGWCALLVINDMTSKSHIFGAVIGYDLWIYLAMVIILTLYLTVQLFLHEKLKQSKKYLRDGEERFREALTILDYRFFLIPLMFAMLRMWTCMLFIFEVYKQVKGVPIVLRILLAYLSGIGDSAQGFVNGILFVLFTKKVRNTVFNFQYWRRIIRRGSLLDEETAALLNGVQTCNNTREQLGEQKQYRKEQRLTITGTSDIFTPATITQSYAAMN